MSLSCNVICVISMWWLNELQLLLCSVIFDEVTTFFLRGRNPYRHQVTYGGGGGSGVVVPDSNWLKPPRWPTQLRSEEPWEPERATHRAPPAHRMHRLRSRRQSGSPTGLPSGPEALIYQYLTLTPTGGCPRRLPRPRRSILSGWELRTLALSAATFRSITCSQKEVTALLPLSLANSTARIAGGERSRPISAMRSRRGRAHAGQNSNVCCAESTLASQWWQRAVASFLIRCKYSPKHPCPVITCVTL